MTLLLDTHALPWFWWADPQLSVNATAAICGPANRKFTSPASSWEVAIKVSRKKLDLGAPYRGFIHMHTLRNNFEYLPIADEHLAGLIDMPFHHKDPFARMLIAQASCEDIPIVSVDAQLDAYAITRIW